MAFRRSRLTLLAVLLGVGAVLGLFATHPSYLPGKLLTTHSSLPSSAQEHALTRAETYLRAFRNDSVLLLTSRLMANLNAQGQAETPFGLRVRLAQATALEATQQNELALEKLLTIEQLSRQHNLWEIHARASLGLALIYEKADQVEPSRQQLDEAKADIERHGLSAVYPRFAVRRASWERFHGQKTTAMRLAREAVQTAPGYGLLKEEADGHLLIGSLLPESTFAERRGHALAAVCLFRQLNDSLSVGYMFEGLTRLYAHQQQWKQALRYNDSTISLARRLLTNPASPRVGLMGEAYNDRANLYQQWGLPDSALVYLGEATPLLLKAQILMNGEQITRVEARYQDRLKQQQLDEQTLSLRLKNNQLRLSGVIGLLVVSLAVGLLLGYRKQRQDKHTLVAQNKLVEQQATQLRAIDAGKSRFFANVSHELRTPLTLLLGPVGTLLTENHLTDRQANLLHLAQRNGRQLEQLVTDILDLGKLEMGQLTLNEKPTPVARFFRSHLAQFASLAESRHLHYTTDVAVADEVVALLDQPKYRQLLNNLLANAVKFTPMGGQITASLWLASGHLHLTVADTGAGIHPDDLPQVFNRYFQTTRPEKAAEGGTGIGLALCQEYAYLMGGTIGVSSPPGEGTTFWVAIPVTVLPADTRPVWVEQAVPAVVISDTPAPPPLPTAALPTDRPTLLVVEDNPDLLAYLRLLLTDHYDLLTAENGQVALDLLRVDRQGPRRIALVLSDVMMPVMDGYQLLTHLKADDATCHLPVVMLTARADARDRLQALRVGVDDYLLKPFEAPELLARLHNLLTNQAIRRQAQPEQPAPTTYPTLSPVNQQWLETFEQYVRQRIADTTLTVPHLAEQFAMSESTLLRQLKRLTGLSPNQYVLAVRLDEARHLLEKRVCRTVTEVAVRVGYDDVRSFSRGFRARFGKLPSEWLEA